MTFETFKIIKNTIFSNILWLWNMDGVSLSWRENIVQLNLTAKLKKKNLYIGLRSEAFRMVTLFMHKAIYTYVLS